MPLLDIEMGRKPYQRIHFDLYMKILKELDSRKRYKDILSQFPKAEISKMTISNIFKSFNIRELNKGFQEQEPTKKVKFNSDYLYVGVDDTYTNLFEKHKQISKKVIRMAYSFTGFDKTYIAKSRKKLANQKVFNLIADKRFMHYSDKLRTILENNYELDNKKIVIIEMVLTELKN